VKLLAVKTISAFVAAAVLSVGVGLSPASAYDLTADWRLVAAPGPYNASFMFSVRIPTSGDYVDYSVVDAAGADVIRSLDKLEIDGLDGPDPDYFGYRALVTSYKPLPVGNYVVTVRAWASAQWKCSKFYSSGCIWFEAVDVSKTYDLVWLGATIVVYPRPEPVVEMPAPPTSVPTTPTPEQTPLASEAMTTRVTKFRVKRSGSKVVVRAQVNVAGESFWRVKAKLQRKTVKGWKTVKSLTSSTTGGFETSWKYAKKAHLRLLVPATSEIKKSASKSVTVSKYHR
jgi:hypothetical protein